MFDITYIPTLVGFLYLSVAPRAFSRRIVGWSMANHLRTELVLAALEMALAQRKPGGVIHHSDQGCQYTSVAFGARCRVAGVRPSMGSVGECYDNAMCESFLLGSNANYLIASGSRPGRRHGWLSSNLSKAGTIRIAVTQRFVISHQ